MLDQTPQVREMVRRYQQGARILDIAEAYKISPSEVTKLLVDAKIPVRPSRAEQPRKELPGVVGRYESGMALSELAILYGVAPSTVRRRLHDAGARLRPQGHTARNRRSKTADAPASVPTATESGQGRTE